MTEGVARLCALAILGGVLMSLMPEGGVRRVAAIGCTAALLLTAVNLAGKTDPGVFSFDLARYHELSEELTANAQEARDRLDRSVIEAEYESYICDEAARLGIEELDAAVTARWDMAGLYLPWQVELSGQCGEREKLRLTERITAELGVPEERVIWTDGG